MSTLLILRHAEAESFRESDQQRRLTNQGAQRAKQVGNWLRHEGLMPHHALVSSAVRTRQTWKQVAADFRPMHGVRYDDRLYEAEVSSSLMALAESPPAAEIVLYIGHNPTVVELMAHVGVEGWGGHDPGFRFGFPPAGLVVVTGISAWPEIAHGVGSLARASVGGQEV